MTQSELQADAVAKIALTLPVNPSTYDVLRALAMVYRQSWHDCLEHTQTLAKKMLENHV